MKLTRRRHDNSANSMWWEWPIVRRRYLYHDLRRHRPVWTHAEWMKVCDAIEALPAFERSNNFGNDYVDLRDLAGKIQKKSKTDRRIFKAWKQARTEEQKRQVAEAMIKVAQAILRRRSCDQQLDNNAPGASVNPRTRLTT